MLERMRETERGRARACVSRDRKTAGKREYKFVRKRKVLEWTFWRVFFKEGE